MSRPMSRLGLGRNRGSSSGSIKVDLNETSQDKARYKFTSKADPTKAINEAQPSQLQSMGETTINSIRSIEHRDNDGNVITDPDRSNPTRPRLERPLDTIRSFEAAIDGSYSRRQSVRPESANPLSAQSRRSSGFFGGYQPQQQRNYYDYGGGGGGGYYANGNGNRNSMSQSRPDSYIDNYGGSSGQYNGGRRFGPRTHSDPMLYGRNGDQGIYQSHGHHQSYDTVGTTSNGSHFTDQWGNSTDPSSENSSVDKFQPAPAPPPKQDLGEVYGFNGFGGAPQFQGPILEEYSQGSPAYGEPGYGRSNGAHHDGYNARPDQMPPSVPPHRAPMPPPKTGGPNVMIKSRPPPPSARPRQAVDQGEKRKSWLKRRFSKS